MHDSCIQFCLNFHFKWPLVLASLHYGSSKKGPVGLILYRRWGSRWVEPASWILKFSLQNFNLAPTQYRQLCRLFKIVILILVCVKIIIQAATPPQFLLSSQHDVNVQPRALGTNLRHCFYCRRVVKERSCKEERCRHFDCSHGLSSVCSPRLRHHSACIWFFNDSIWYCKHYRCTSLVFLRRVWNMGRHLGKESKLYSLSWRNLMRNFLAQTELRFKTFFVHFGSFGVFHRKLRMGYKMDVCLQV